MKNLYLTPVLLIAVLIASTGFSQIPNSGFEQWSGSNPNGWLTTNFFGIGTPISPVSPGHTGEAALKGEIITVFTGDTLIPLITSGQFGEGFAVSEQFGALTGYFKFSPVSGEHFGFIILMYNGDNVVGSGALFIPNATSTFTQFTVPIEYFVSDIPDKCIIQITIDDPQNGLPHPGSYYIIDDLAFSAATDLNSESSAGILTDYKLWQNYPNPFNPVTQIHYAIPGPAQVKLQVYNSLGQKVADLVDEYVQAGSHVVKFDAAQLPGGVYFYQLKAGDNFTEIRKMILLK